MLASAWLREGAQLARTHSVYIKEPMSWRVHYTSYRTHTAPIHLDTDAMVWHAAYRHFVGRAEQRHGQCKRDNLDGGRAHHAAHQPCTGR